MDDLDFKIKTSESLARIESTLEKLPCETHSKLLDEFKTFKTQVLMVISIAGFIWSFMSDTLHQLINKIL